jgi:hypothetical protein
LEDSEEISSYPGELIGQPGENRNRSKGGDSEEEINSQFVGSGICDTAEKRVAVHLGEDGDETKAEEYEEESEAPVDEPMGLEGVGVPGNDGEYEGSRYEEHQIPHIDEHSANERHIANYDEFFGEMNEGGAAVCGLIQLFVWLFGSLGFLSFCGFVGFGLRINRRV